MGQDTDEKDKSNNTVVVNASTPLFTPNKLCRQCHQEIPVEAKKCHHCNEYQSRLRTFLSNVPVLVSVVMVSLGIGQLMMGYNQLQEAKRERTLASEALQKASEAGGKASLAAENAEAAKDKAESASIEVSKLSSNANTIVNQIGTLRDNTVKSVTRLQAQLKTVSNESISLKHYVEATKEKNDKQLNVMSTQVTFLQERNALLKLADSAISYGDAEAFEELMKRYQTYQSSPSNGELLNAVLAEIFLVKSFYLSGSRIEGASITRKYSQEGKLQSKDEEIQTHALIDTLKNNEDWTARAQAAKLLSSRHEKGVPDALLTAENDTRLDVRVIALTSFTSITGYKKIDVFGFDDAKKWWDKNKTDVNKRLQEK